MSDDFFRDPVLDSPYELPTHHRELDEDGQPATRKREGRRSVSFVTPIPKPRKRQAGQGRLGLGETTTAVREDDQKYELARIIDSVGEAVGRWRGLDEDGWGVTPATERLLRHWREHEFSGIRPFFCQLEAEAATGGAIRQGFVYGRVPHVTLKSIADNAETDVIWEKWQGIPEPLRAELDTALGGGGGLGGVGDSARGRRGLAA